MASVIPPFRGVIYITSIGYYTGDFEFALWLYQRLRYRGFPVWMQGPDDGPPGAFSREGAIYHAKTVLYVFDSLEHADSISSDISHAYGFVHQNPATPAPEITTEAFVLLVGKQNDISEPEIVEYPVFDFRAGREDAFQSLVATLKERRYPVPMSIDGKGFLDRAEYFYRHHPEMRGERSMYVPLDYLKAMRDLARPHVRSMAINALAELQCDSEMILAALCDDPSPDVRAEAALALVRYNNQRHRRALQTASISDESVTVRLHAQIALLALELPYDQLTEAFNDLVDTLDSEFAILLRNAKWRVDELVKALSDLPKPIFISYSRRDAETFSLTLAEKLKNAGLSVWIDTELEPGTPVWMKEIEKAIEDASLCLVVLSPAIHDSQWVPREVEYARQFNKTIIPIKYQETHKPIYLTSDQGLRDDLSYSEHPDLMLNALVSSLKRLVK